jgi:Protein of unknown function (DUF1524)
VKVSKSARYYLRCLERTAQGLKEPAWIPNEDANAINLEHVMPSTICEHWKNVSEQDVETHSSRLGNLALMQASENVIVDRESFAKKKPILAKSPYLLTSMIGDQFGTWGVKEIETRQKKLAEYAAATWPV